MEKIADNDKKKDESPKDESTQKPTGKSYNVIQPGQNQKTLLITTDGRNIQLCPNNINALETEMMLIKALNYIRGAKHA